jgi:hypothetical protein
MALQSIDNLFANPAYFYMGAEGAETTLGYTKGGGSYTPTTTTVPIVVDQRGTTPVKKNINGRGATIKVMLAEDALETYLTFLPGTEIQTDAVDSTKKKIVVGQNIGLDLLSVAKSFLIKPATGAGPTADRNKWVRFFKVVATDNAPTIEYSLDNQRVFEATFEAFPSEDDLDPDGQPALYVIGDETATPAS